MECKFTMLKEQPHKEEKIQCNTDENNKEKLDN
jgi:hypothetical protein